MGNLITPLDIAIFLGSLVSVMAIGLWVGRKEETSLDYFLADRKTRWWGVAGSIFGSNISAHQIIGMMGIGFSVGFAQSHFEIDLRTALPESRTGTLTTAGFDKVEFLFSPNPGEPPRPLRSIASSGEMARVMLAIKTVLAVQDRIPVLIFDEVDANIGGQVAHAVGERMCRLGQQHQVLCITHLAPVAARASAHLLVAKSVRDGRTMTRVERLNESERISELARMLGGEGEDSRRLAASLLRGS